MRYGKCWLAWNGMIEIAGGLVPVQEAAAYKACDGGLTTVHLISQQKLKREKLNPKDPRVCVKGCLYHHAMLDHSKALRIPRASLPATVESYAAEHGLGYWLDREYGPIKE